MFCEEDKDNVHVDHVSSGDIAYVISKDKMQRQDKNPEQGGYDSMHHEQLVKLPDDWSCPDKKNPPARIFPSRSGN